jgi:chemotaxis regulatin CheY-phosphate phosphatase CheZ
MNQQEVEKVLQKAAEVKVFCEYGQRTLPVLDEIAGFMHEISPAIEDLKAVLEVAMVNIPKAAGQLGRVTEATEQASTQILNTLDKMMATLEEVINSVSSGMVESDLGVATKKMADIVKTLVEKSGWDADIVELAEAWAAHLRSMKKTGTTSELERLLKNLQDDCTEIMMALQVSDITQQHIGTVLGTIQAVAESLRKLTTGFFSTPEIQPVSIDINLPLPVDSEVVGDMERKKMVESLLSKARAGQL